MKQIGIVLIACALMNMSCAKKSGVFENAGQNVDQGFQKAGEQIDAAVKKTDENVRRNLHEAGEKIEEATQ